jgi:hypothetical protein
MTDLLSSRKVFFILLALTLVLRIMFESIYPKLVSDHSIQIEAGKNFLDRGQMSSTWVEANDLSQIQSKPLKMWPLGFSFFVVIFHFFTNNYMYSAICFQCLGAVLFILACVRLLSYVGVKLMYVNLFLLLYAVNPAPFAYLGSTDLFTVGLFMWIVYFTLKEMNNVKINYGTILMLSFLVFLTAVIRFACIPNMVIIPLAFFFLWLVKRQRSFLIKSILSFAFTFGMIFVFYKVFPFDNTRTGFLDNLKNGNLYFSLLKWFDPFSFKGLFYSRPIEFRLPHNWAIITAYLVLSMLFAIVFFVAILKRFIPGLKMKKWLQEKRGNTTLEDHLTFVFIATFLVVVGFVTLQTLTTPPESNSFGPSWMPPVWTFVYCTRYFIYLMALIVIMFFIKLETAKKWMFAFYTICFVWGGLNFLYNNYQFFTSNGNGGGSSWINDKPAITTYALINTLPAGNLVIYGHHTNKRKEGLITNFSKAHPTDDYERIIAEDFQTTRPVTLLLSMPKELSVPEVQFLEKHAHKILANLDKEQLIQFDLK